MINTNTRKNFELQNKGIDAIHNPLLIPLSLSLPDDGTDGKSNLQHIAKILKDMPAYKVQLDDPNQKFDELNEQQRQEIELKASRYISNQVNRAMYDKAVEDDAKIIRKDNLSLLKNKKAALAKFAKLVMRSAKKRGFNWSMMFNERNSEVVISHEGKRTSVGLLDLHEKFHEAPFKNRQEILDLHFKVVAEKIEFLQLVASNYEDVKSYLMPLIRNSSSYENHAHKMNDPLHNIPSIRFSEDASISLGFDSKNSIAHVEQIALEKWGVTFDDAMEDAMKNLQNKTCTYFDEIKPGLFKGSWQDFHDSSRILLSKVVGRTDILNEPVFMIPTFNCMLMTSADDKTGQMEMLEQFKEETNRARNYVSTNFYQYKDGEILEYTPTHESVLKELSHIKQVVLHRAYGEQQQHLRIRFARNGIDEIVSTFDLVNIEKHYAASMCEWKEEVKQTIPKTDYIVLLMPKDSSAKFSPIPKLVKWSDVVEILGDSMIEISLYPKRYSVTGYPTAEQFEALNCVVPKS